MRHHVGPGAASRDRIPKDDGVSCFDLFNGSIFMLPFGTFRFVGVSFALF
jgi:hypothetical protein